MAVAPGQIVEGGWFRLAVFDDKACGRSLGGGTLHAIDFFYDNLTSELTRFFSKSATIELVNARGESFGVFGGRSWRRVVGPASPWGTAPSRARGFAADLSPGCPPASIHRPTFASCSRSRTDSPCRR